MGTGALARAGRLRQGHQLPSARESPRAGPADHSTISRTRRLIDLETHRAVFTWVLQCLGGAGLVKGKTLGIDATTLEASAALCSIVRRDTGEAYQDFLTKLAQASGIETPTRSDLTRIDRKGANKGWRNPHDPDARITKMKDGRTHLAHKAEHAVDLDTGAIVGITVQGADQGDATAIETTLPEAIEQLEAVAAVTDDTVATGDELVADTGYHSKPKMLELQTLGVRTYISEPDRGPQGWIDQHPERDAVYATVVAFVASREAPLAAPRRTVGTAERAAPRDRRNAPHPSARPHQHFEAAVHPRQRVQSRAPHADAVRGRHAARAARAPRGRVRRHARAVDTPRAPVGARFAPQERFAATIHTASAL